MKKSFVAINSLMLGLLITSPVLAKPIHHHNNNRPKAETPIMPFQPGTGETTYDPGNTHFISHKISVCVEPDLLKKPGFKTALKKAEKTMPQYHFTLLKNNYHANITIIPVEFESGQASKTQTFQYTARPNRIHRSLIEINYNTAKQQNLNQIVLNNLQQAVGLN